MPRPRPCLQANALVESVDIYPTLAALAGLAAPPDVDGTDLSPLWKSPTATISDAVFSEYPRCAPLSAAWTPEPGHATPQSCVNTPRANFTFMGYSVRTDGWRCTFWMYGNFDMHCFRAFTCCQRISQLHPPLPRTCGVTCSTYDCI